VRFGSEAWFAAIVAALNRHPDLPRALDGLGPDAGAVVEPDEGWPEPTGVYGHQRGGRIDAWRVLPDPDDLLELEPAYVFRAPYRVWRDLVQGGDPVRAALSGRVAVEGDLEALLRRAEFRYIVDAALAAVATELPEDGGA
jgi:hypothetical protein